MNRDIRFFFTGPRTSQKEKATIAHEYNDTSPTVIKLALCCYMQVNFAVVFVFLFFAL